jgi:hypothetical protein
MDAFAAGAPHFELRQTGKMPPAPPRQQGDAKEIESFGDGY